MAGFIFTIAAGVLTLVLIIIYIKFGYKLRKGDSDDAQIVEYETRMKIESDMRSRGYSEEDIKAYWEMPGR